MSMERPGSTRIISILPEGSWVKGPTLLPDGTVDKPGDVVCTLDSAAFRDELQLQRIRHAQARAWVEQAKTLQEVSEISLNEYRDGIYPQDVELIRQYILICTIEKGRAEGNYLWSKGMAEKGFRTPTQLRADLLALNKAQIQHREAEQMAVQLDKYTAPRLMKNLQAKIAAIRADRLAQDQAFEIESDRLRKLEAMVEHCTVRAPADGLVVYANIPDRGGQIMNPIQEGATVRQGQPIFYLPDPNRMQVKAKVNESKVRLIHSGARALIRIDAFPNRPLRGTVTDITAIPAPAAGPMSDVKGYHAVVMIDGGGFSELRPGLSAEVTFLAEARHKVTRVPVGTIRFFNARPYVAVVAPQPPRSRRGSNQAGPSWSWQPVVLGVSDVVYSEILSGLKAGEAVVARPEGLPKPRAVPPPRQVFASNGGPGDQPKAR